LFVIVIVLLPPRVISILFGGPNVSAISFRISIDLTGSIIICLSFQSAVSSLLYMQHRQDFGIYLLLILIYNVMHRRTSHERSAMKTIKDLSEMTGRSCWTIYQYQRFGAFGEIESDRIGGTIVFGDKDVPKLVKILKDVPAKGRKKKK
jgi:hypothetical protein